jgi:hypothetical protein
MKVITIPERLFVVLAIMIWCLSPSHTAAQAWTATTSYPLAGYQWDPVEVDGFVYVIGGYNGSAVNNVFYSAIQSDGSLGGWTESTPHPEADQGPGAAAHNCWIYIALGNGSVYRARTVPGGGIGSWIACPSAGLNRGGRLLLRTHSGFLYIFGGWHPGFGFFSEVFVSRINPDGSIGAWNTTTLMPQSRQHQAIHFYNNRAYIIGGIGGGGFILDSVYSAPLDSSGNLGAWRAETSLPSTLWYHNSIIVDNEIYLFGGRTQYGDSGYNNKIYRGVVSASDGMISAWAIVDDMPDEQGDGKGAVYAPSSRMAYLIGGSPPYTAKVWYKQFTSEIADARFFQEKFTQPVPWVSDDPALLQVNPDAETFSGVQANFFGTYAYTNLPGFDPNRSWALQFEHRINSNEWSAGITVGLFDVRLQYPYGAGLDMGEADGGRGTALFGDGNVAGAIFNPAWQAGVWYRTRIRYDASIQVLAAEVLERDSGLPLVALTLPVTAFTPETTRFGVSRRHMLGGTNGVNPSARVEFDLDNIWLTTTPRISIGPISQTVSPGSHAVLRVEVSGGGPYSYQWQFKGENIVGATSAILSLNCVRPGNCGNYRVIVRNPAGEIISREALLSVFGVGVVPYVEICGAIGQAYQIDYTTEIGPNATWLPLNTILLQANPHRYIDAAALDQPRRFYRAVAVP